MEYTDPASELAALFSKMSIIEPRHPSHSTQVTLSRHFKIDAASADWYELIGAIAFRIRALRSFVSTVDDRFVKEKMRSETLKSLDHMARFLSPDQMAAKWHIVKADLFTDDHIGRLESFAAIGEKYKPLRKLNDEQRHEILDKIDEAIILLDGDDVNMPEIPAWASAPILEGLRSLHRIISHLEFFGHQFAIDEILKLHSRAKSIAESDLPDSVKLDLFPKIRNAMHVLFFVGELLLLPANAYQGYHVYKEVALEMIIAKKHETLAITDKNRDMKMLTGPSLSSSEVKNGPR
ncbi:hypothetical protein N9H93_01105 [Rhizobiaceae bacterium]|nr:hypothetical protein [Rhizobiaceae bacterium]